MARRRPRGPAGGKGADFSVTLEDDSLAPFFRAGETVFLQRSAELGDGEIGLFYTRGGMAFRQFCQDSRGAVYLFSPDRSKKHLDLSFPPGAELPVCYGRVMLSPVPELPMD